MRVKSVNKRGGWERFKEIEFLKDLCDHHTCDSHAKGFSPVIQNSLFLFKTKRFKNELWDIFSFIIAPNKLIPDFGRAIFLWPWPLISKEVKILIKRI